MPERTHYDVLGVARGASAAEIRRAYRALAKAHHPDTGPAGSAEMFGAIARAYEVLADAAARRKYDESLARAESEESGRTGQAHYSWENIAARAPARADVSELDAMYDTFFVERSQRSRRHE